MTGHANAKVLAPLLLLLRQHERLKPGTWLRGSASPIESDAIHAKYPQAGRSIQFCFQVKDVCSPALVAFIHLLGPAYGNDPGKTNEFVEKLGLQRERRSGESNGHSHLHTSLDSNRNGDLVMIESAEDSGFRYADCK